MRVGDPVSGKRLIPGDEENLRFKRGGAMKKPEVLYKQPGIVAFSVFRNCEFFLFRKTLATNQRDVRKALRARNSDSMRNLRTLLRATALKLVEHTQNDACAKRMTMSGQNRRNYLF